MNFSSFYMNFLLCISPIFRCIFINFLWCKISLIFYLRYSLLSRRGIDHFNILFWRIGPLPFLSKDGKDAVHEGRNGWRGVCFPPMSEYFPFVDNMSKVFFPLCTLIWRVIKYVSRQGKGINMRNESTIIII